MWKMCLGVAARCILGIIWIVSGIPKVMHHFEATQAIDQYRLVPYSWAEILSVVQPVAEISIGLFLIAGILTKTNCVLSIALLIAYIAGIVSLGMRHIKVNCGCFDLGGYNPQAGWKTYSIDITRDVIFIALALLAFAWAVSWSELLAVIRFKRVDLSSAPTEDNSIAE